MHLSEFALVSLVIDPDEMVAMSPKRERKSLTMSQTRLSGRCWKA